MPAGNVSVKEMPVRFAGLAAGAVIVNESVEVPPGTTPLGVNDLVITGGAITLNVAVLLTGPAAGISVVETPDVTFDFVPAVELVTSKMTVQPAGGIVMPPKLSAVAPTTMLDGVIPTQVPDTGPPTAVMPTKVSLNVAPVRSTAFGLESVRDTVLLPPAGIDASSKPLVIVGGPRIVHAQLTGKLETFPAVSIDLTRKR